MPHGESDQAIHRPGRWSPRTASIPWASISTLDLVGASLGRLLPGASRDRLLTLLKEAGEPKEVHVAAWPRAPPLFDVDAYVDDFNRGIVPAYRRGNGRPRAAGRRRRCAQHHPAGHGRHPRLQPPGAADPGADRARSAWAAWPASTPAPTRAILGDRRPGVAARRRDRRLRRRPRPDAELAARPRSRTSCDTTKYGDVPGQARASSRPVRDLRGPGPLQGLRRVRRGLRRARPRRPAHDRQGRRRSRSGESTLERYGRDMALLPLPAADARSSTATRRRWPT